MSPLFTITVSLSYEEVVELLVCRATTTAATAAAAIATVVDTAAAAPAAAPEAAALDPAAPAPPEAPPLADAEDEDEDCANVGTAKDITNMIVDNSFKIRIKLTPTFS